MREIKPRPQPISTTDVLSSGPSKSSTALPSNSAPIALDEKFVFGGNLIFIPQILSSSDSEPSKNVVVVDVLLILKQKE